MEDQTLKNENSQVFNIGCLVYERMDQIDFTGPFEVLSRMPNVVYHVIGKTMDPIKDIKGLIITPTVSISEVPDLDLLHVPGGVGQMEANNDEAILSLIRDHYQAGKYVFSVCTGTLICGAAGILKGLKATTHWASWDLLSYYGAIPVKQRVIQQGKFISAAGITAGIDGSLVVASILFGDFVAQSIQLQLEYAPEPPFNSGTPELAPADVLEDYQRLYGRNKVLRENAAQKFYLDNNISLS